jgi:hypothetical protein
MTITAVREGRKKGADDTETLTIRQDGHTLIVTRAPPERCRIARGICEVMRRSRLSADVRCAWRELREYALGELHLIIDPMDDPAPDDRTPGGGWDPSRWAAPNPYRTGAGR